MYTDSPENTSYDEWLDSSEGQKWLEEMAEIEAMRSAWMGV